MAEGKTNPGPNPSRMRQILRNLKSVCCKWTRSKRDHAPECCCHPCVQNFEQSLPLLSSFNSNESRATSPEYDAPDFRPWSVDLQPIAGSWESSDDQDDHAPDSVLGEPEDMIALGVHSCQSEPTKAARPGLNGEENSFKASPETKHELDAEENQQASRSRRDSLVENLSCLQSQICAQREEIELLLGGRTEDVLFEQEDDEDSRNINELSKNSNSDSVLVNLGALDARINSLAALLPKLTDELSEPFYAMAWLAVHQIRGLGGTLADLLFDMKRTDVLCDKRIISRGQSHVNLSRRASLCLSNSAKEVIERCGFLVTRLEHLGLEATAPKPCDERDACIRHGQET